LRGLVWGGLKLNREGQFQNQGGRQCIHGFIQESNGTSFLGMTKVGFWSRIGTWGAGEGQKRRGGVAAALKEEEGGLLRTEILVKIRRSIRNRAELLFWGPPAITPGVLGGERLLGPLDPCERRCAWGTGFFSTVGSGETCIGYCSCGIGGSFVIFPGGDLRSNETIVLGSVNNDGRHG